MAETGNRLSDLLRYAYGDDSYSTADLVNALRPPSHKPWGGLKSYLPTRPEWWPAKDSLPMRFLSEGLPLALMGLPGRAPPRATTLPALPRTTSPGEWPTQAAVRIGDRTFTGNSHFDAVTKAQEVLGEKVTHRLLSEGGDKVATDGFLTNTGRYVSREEAGRMLDEHNGTNRFTSSWLTGRPKTGMNSLLTEGLEQYNPTTGRPK